MNKKNILIISVILILVLITTIGVLSLRNNKDVDKNDLEDVVNPQDEIQSYIFKLTFDYKIDLEDEYVIDLEGEKVTIITKDIEPVVNTSELGQTEHTLNVDNKEITLVIDVVDKRTIELDETEVEVKVGTTVDKLTKQIYAELILDNLDGVEYELNTDNLDLDTPNEGEVELFVYYIDNEDNNANINVKVVVVDNVDSDRSDVVEQPRPEEPKPEVKPEPKPEQPKPIDPKPEIKPDPKPEPKPEQPKPIDPKPENPKPEEPKSDKEARYPLKKSESIPNGAKLKESIIEKTEELYKYSYNVELSGKGSITNVTVGFSDTMGKRINIDGKDVNGEPLYYTLLVDKNKVQFEWRMPELSPEDNSTLDSIAKQFATAYGQ